MRKLPIYFLIDVSESMVGEPVQQVEEGIAHIIKALKQDPYALETVYISVLVFAGQARTLVPLQELIQFYPPRLPIGGGTSLSKGLGHLMYELRKNTVCTTPTQKGDWKPIIYLFTDGVPTDESKTAIAEWQQQWARKANLVAIAFGQETDLQVLQQLTENVFLFKNTSPKQYTDFFAWVTASIRTSSISVDNNGSGFELSKLPENVMEKIDLNKLPATQGVVDDNFAVFTAKCQRSQRPYLIKYRKDQQRNDLMGLDLETRYYQLVGAFTVDNTYFELSDKTATFSQQIASDELVGFPSCPSCGNQYGFSVCTCGHVHCTGTEQTSTCPWCGQTGNYGLGGGNMDLNRSQG
ncbi:Uncharacterized conserved protein YegL, contains vWA domain of TerY type [Chitinophaga costaii]|uniref:Uncharacterized conserved protein YegL, contains vWA domain of TerY type n=1 Tax=Chitinophaga costaii TaxID=1335309 RepID=A0A1C4APL1_9BACT|nr:TerY-C metal binding domain-containing protein [Chitinophaga costaii]PUZ26696.1 VWA domain-containing protein [Chitinophaga costaii]SCB96610.1 Uncharacterized conserved protein YegL, contains vWA domain of TerY type [Chitinophaga costaii]